MTGNPRLHPKLSVAFDLGQTRVLDGAAEAQAATSTKVETRNLSVKYRDFTAIRDITLSFPERKVSALIGSSGSGKSTLLRAINRMHDANPTVKVDGQVLLDGEPVYGTQVDPIMIRRRIGMVFQRPNPFTKSIFDNVAYGLSFGAKLS
jgi:phosphate transport system ATP-binding protein